MAKRGRQPGCVLTEEHRDKIKKSNILNYLIQHVEGKRKMGSTQVTAGLGLLKKALPDLSSVEHSGEMAIENKISKEQRDAIVAAAEKAAKRK